MNTTSPDEQQLREKEQAVVDLGKPMSFVPENRRVQNNERTVAFFFICLLLTISALCAGLPGTEPYGDKDPSLFDYESGDIAWVIVASALGRKLYTVPMKIKL
jgi:hypothetical protein